MEDYPGKYFARRDPHSSWYIDHFRRDKDIRVVASCEATRAPEVPDEQQYQEVRLKRPYWLHKQLLQAVARDLTPTMRRVFFGLGVSCHMGGIHRGYDIPGISDYPLQTVRALERRRLLTFHGGQYSNVRVEMTELGKELWRAIYQKVSRQRWFHVKVQEVYEDLAGW